jgi:hypothetical protein
MEEKAIAGLTGIAIGLVIVAVIFTSVLIYSKPGSRKKHRKDKK